MRLLLKIENHPAPCIIDSILKGLIPVENSKEYKMKIASYTQGKGMFITKIYGYKEVPADFKKARQKTTYDPLNKKEYLLYIGKVKKKILQANSYTVLYRYYTIPV